MINAERAKAGVAPLTRNAKLDALAGEWAVRMAEKNSQFHRELTKSLLNDNGWKNLSENIYGPVADDSPWAILQAWMNSDGHRGNLLRESSTLGGVGLARTKSGEVCAVFNGAQPKPPAQSEKASSFTSSGPSGYVSPSGGVFQLDSVPGAMRDSSASLPSNSDGRKLNQLNWTNK
ncbi:MAG: CAP domain-containing protein [Verrucomicrobia bacterium]|nr:CAP domain-containing protein [Verrucomicrobiota bacterium]